MDRRLSIGAELRASKSGDDFVIEGIAVRYNSLSNANVPMAGCRERVAPGCFRAYLAGDDHDVVALRDHDSSQILGRESNGTLKLMDGPDALRFRIQLNPDVSAHRDLHALVKDGTLADCSFAFAAEDDDWSAGTDENGKRCQIRTLKRAKIGDVSIVTRPAYPSTSASARAEAAQSAFEASAAALEDFAKASTAKKKAEIEERKAEEALRETREQFEKVRLF